MRKDQIDCLSVPVSVCLDYERGLPDFWRRLRREAYPNRWFLPLMFCCDHFAERVVDVVWPDVLQLVEERTKTKGTLTNRYIERSERCRKTDRTVRFVRGAADGLHT